MTQHKRILIADDDQRVLLILQATLERMDNGYQIATAHDGRHALAQIRDGAFDLLITDIRMPGLDGIELTEAIRTFDMEIAIIWITAYGCTGLHAERERLGIYRCLDKPLRIGQIRQAAREALDNKQAQDRTDE